MGAACVGGTGQGSPGSQPCVLGTSGTRVARALLTHLATPIEPVLSGLLGVMDPDEVLACIRSGSVPTGAADRLDSMARPRLESMLSRWRRRLADLPADGGIVAARAGGIRLICPGDPEWPSALDDLGAGRPCALWARGSGDLRECITRSVAVVGTRAATAYGVHVTGEITTGLAAAGLTIISGAAYGVDAAAHRATLAAGAPTVAVLACGPDVSYPREHAGLLQQITARGVVVSEYPPRWRPTRAAFLVRNRIIAALGVGGMVVMEAGLRSGTLNAVSHADLLGRLVMAVPGPVTSAASAGCHQLIADCGIPCVTCADDVLYRLDV